MAHFEICNGQNEETNRELEISNSVFSETYLNLLLWGFVVKYFISHFKIEVVEKLKIDFRRSVSICQLYM